MARTRNLKLKCPICKKAVTSQDTEFPFCSDRCRLIDLGAWLTEQHKIPDETAEEGEAIHSEGADEH